MCSVRMIIAAIVPLLAGLPGPAVHAQTSPDAAPPDVASENRPESPSAPNAPGALNESNDIGIALSATALDDLRGGSGLVLNDMQLNGTVADTRARQVITGNNTISEGSFANASGLPTVIQNSGANVLIQNATIVNVQFGQ
jgi:hypothetical protein